MTARAIRRMTLHVVNASAATRWMFIRLQRADGRIGCGEATLNGKEAAVRDAAQRFSIGALSASVDNPEAFAADVVPVDLAEAAVVSAIDQALWDLHAIDAGARLVDVLGGAQRETIPIYANINRRTRVRTPEAFAQSARDAMAAGFDALKIAPFDEVDPRRCAAGDGSTAMRVGLDRIAAVRAVAGPDRRLMVDCHWRFDEATARSVVDAAAALGVYWIECPLPESLDNIPALVRLRKQANARGIRLAGMEQAIRFDAFRPFCEAGAYDVMMPDVKYVGGLMEMLRCGPALTRHGVAISLHNPSGPICHAASLHAAAALDVFDMLELQFDESPLFDRLVGDALPPRVAGHSALPSRPGLGIHLDAVLLDENADGCATVWDAR